MDRKEFICLTEDGDRTIIVGEAEDGQRHFKVDSRSMAMASPIWKAMFSSSNGFRESNPNEPVEFPEDDADALLILLRIIHYRFDEVPKELPSFNSLLEIAVLCDKYDMTRLVRPFIEGWMRPWVDFYLEPGYEHWLFIAWTFGCQEIFETLTTALVLKIEVYQDGKIKRWVRPRSREASQDSTLSREEAWISDENMPPEIIDSILKVREEIIRRLKDLFLGIGASLMDYKLCQRPESHDHVYCCTYMLGRFTKSLDRFGLISPWVPPSKIVLSIRHISYHLNNFMFRLDLQGYVSPCDLGTILVPELESILKDIPSAVMDHHIRHIEEQVKKSGLANLSLPSHKKGKTSEQRLTSVARITGPSR